MEALEELVKRRKRLTEQIVETENKIKFISLLNLLSDEQFNDGKYRRRLELKQNELKQTNDKIRLHPQTYAEPVGKGAAQAVSQAISDRVAAALNNRRYRPRSDSEIISGAIRRIGTDTGQQALTHSARALTEILINHIGDKRRK